MKAKRSDGITILRTRKPWPGDLVIASRWGDEDPNDPWEVGILKSIELAPNGKVYYKVNTERGYPHCRPLHASEGQWICHYYPSMEAAAHRPHPGPFELKYETT